MPEDSPVGLHFAVSRVSTQADFLLQRINRAISETAGNGKRLAWEQAHLAALRRDGVFAD